MKKILVVEDEYYARKSIVKILQESDLDIQVCGEAANGMKAIELLEEYKDIALVITDIQMQKMGGLELASYLHKHILFCEDEIRDTYIDDGNVQNLKAKIEEGTLFINTDMDASYFTVYAEKCLDNAVVNGQNWEIKKEKEGYYKIALEK